MKNLVTVTNLVTLVELCLSLILVVFLNYFIENLRQHLKILEGEDGVMEEILFMSEGQCNNLSFSSISVLIFQSCFS